MDTTKTRKGGSRWPLLAASALLAVGLIATPALAKGPNEGMGELGVRNLSERTLEVGGRTYKVTSSTIIIDREGRKIQLKELPVRDHDDAPDVTLVVAARYSASEVQGQPVLLRLELIETPR